MRIIRWHPIPLPEPDEDAFFTFASLPISLLQEGDNVIAVEMHQSAVNSSDLSFDLDLTATRTNAFRGSDFAAEEHRYQSQSKEPEPTGPAWWRHFSL